MSKSQTAERGPSPELGDMTSEEFRRVGHELIDWIADYFENIEELPVLAQIEPGELKAQLPPSPPEHGESMEQIIADLDKLIVPALTHWSHPSFFAYFATSTSATRHSWRTADCGVRQQSDVVAHVAGFHRT